MAETLVLPRRFNGPPTTGHGGYTSGRVAGFVEGSGPVAVSLRAPPPLEAALDVVREDGGVRVWHEDTLVAIANPTGPPSDPPEPVSVADADAVAPDPAVLSQTHPFPTCFACGPDRAPGDGLRLFAAPLPGDPAGRFAVTWSPPAELAGPDGALDPVFAWAGLDCPSGSPAIAGGDACVLARFAVALREPVVAGEPHVIVSRLVRSDGRKRATTVALYDAAGTLRAHAEALWVRLP